MKDTLMFILTTKVLLEASFGSCLKSTSKEYFKALKSTICCEICCPRSFPSIHLSHQNDSTGDFCRQRHSAISTQEMEQVFSLENVPGSFTRDMTWSCHTKSSRHRLPWLLLHLIPGKPRAKGELAIHEERLPKPANHKWQCLKWKQTVPDVEELFNSPGPHKTQSVTGSSDKYKPKLHVRGRGTQYMIKAGRTDCTLNAQRLPN